MGIRDIYRLVLKTDGCEPASSRNPDRRERRGRIGATERSGGNTNTYLATYSLTYAVEPPVFLHGKVHLENGYRSLISLSSSGLSGVSQPVTHENVIAEPMREL